MDSSPSKPVYTCPKSQPLTPVQLSTCVFLSACLARSAWSQCRRHAVDSSPSMPVHARLHLSNISPFTPVEVYTWYFSMPTSPGHPGYNAGRTRWTQCRWHAVDSDPSKPVSNIPFYTRRSVCMVFLSARLAWSPWVQCRPDAVDPMPVARGGLKPVQARLHLSKISDFTPFEILTSDQKARGPPKGSLRRCVVTSTMVSDHSSYTIENGECTYDTKYKSSKFQMHD